MEGNEEREKEGSDSGSCGLRHDRAFCKRHLLVCSWILLVRGLNEEIWLSYIQESHELLLFSPLISLLL